MLSNLPVICGLFPSSVTICTCGSAARSRPECKQRADGSDDCCSSHNCREVALHHQRKPAVTHQTGLTPLKGFKSQLKRHEPNSDSFLARKIAPWAHFSVFIIKYVRLTKSSFEMTNVTCPPSCPPLLLTELLQTVL